METRVDLWKRSDQVVNYLDGLRGAIPLAGVQIELIRRLVRHARPAPGRILDLGCGDGVLGRALLDDHPAAVATFLDFSEPMLERARQALGGYGPRSEIRHADYGGPGWVDLVAERAPFDAIVSGYSIHHQPDERKRTVYAEIHALLAPGGIFLNLEHVSSPSPWVAGAHDELFIDSLYAYHTAAGTGLSRDEVANTYYYAPASEANILAPVELQCDWLREIGFQDVDCYFKIFELALFGGVKAGASGPDVARPN